MTGGASLKGAKATERTGKKRVLKKKTPRGKKELKKNLTKTFKA